MDYVRITRTNWEWYRPRVIELNNLFPHRLRAEPFLVDQCFTDIDTIGYVAVDDQVVAYGVSYPLQYRGSIPIPDTNELDIIVTLYLGSCMVDPAYRGQGIGTELRRLRIETGREKSFFRFTAHVRSGKLNTPHKVLAHYPNWYEYGAFDYVEFV